MKYLLDTNIVSQYTKLPPDPRVDAWVQRTDDREMYVRLDCNRRLTIIVIYR